MQDDSLGRDVEDGSFSPLHKGGCTDGVYGCRKCLAVQRRYNVCDYPEMDVDMEADIRRLYGEEGYMIILASRLGELELPTTCEWCRQKGPTSLHRPWDEPGVTYDLCDRCIAEDRAELEEVWDDDGCDQDDGFGNEDESYWEQLDNADNPECSAGSEVAELQKARPARGGGDDW